MRLADIPLIDAIRMITSTPARIMKVSDKIGSLSEGKKADIVVFDGDVNIKMTIIRGKAVHTETTHLSHPLPKF